jgi:tungstate transport system ATP-binding protein
MLAVWQLGEGDQSMRGEGHRRTASDGAAVLRLCDVEVRHGNRATLSVAEFTVARGEVVALIGPNGAGKSTLLHVAALLRYPDRGRIELAGVAATRRTVGALRRCLTMVFQAPLLFDVDVLTNAASGLRFRGIGRREAEARALDWLHRFGVGDLARRTPRTLSGGEAQRVSLARAFAVAPALLLLDEPFAALDAPTRAALVPELSHHLRATQTAALVVTHDQSEAGRLSRHREHPRGDSRRGWAGARSGQAGRHGDTDRGLSRARERLPPWAAGRGGAAGRVGHGPRRG